jgi:hypothetical protein
MPRTLPLNPHLDHLKKQAKALLPALRRRNPVAKLADAQRAIAASYGFGNWTSLKAHVENTVAARGNAPPRPASPLVGVWAVNLAKTPSFTDEAFERAIIDVAIADGSVTLTDVVVDHAGRVECRANDLPVDGLEHAGSHGYAVISYWINGDALGVEVRKHGQAMSRVTYAASADAQTLTVDAATLAHDGYPAVSRTLVFDRVHPMLGCDSP